MCTAQAQVYFPSEMYSALEDALIAFGEQHLGCRAISPIWMSYYVDGCVQELHCDSPHGPFAFVLSLTGGWVGGARHMAKVSGRRACMRAPGGGERECGTINQSNG